MHGRGGIAYRFSILTKPLGILNGSKKRERPWLPYTAFPRLARLAQRCCILNELFPAAILVLSVENVTELPAVVPCTNLRGATILYCVLFLVGIIFSDWVLYNGDFRRNFHIKNNRETLSFIKSRIG